MALILQEEDWLGLTDTVAKLHHRLVIIVGPIATGKSTRLTRASSSYNVTTLNLGEQLSQRLMDYPRDLQPTKAEQEASNIIDDSASKVVAIDNTELLFEFPLELDPLSFLKRMSLNHTIIVTWTGNYSNNCLTYGVLNHPSRREFYLSAQDDFYIINTSDIS